MPFLETFAECFDQERIRAAEIGIDARIHIVEATRSTLASVIVRVFFLLRRVMNICEEGRRQVLLRFGVESTETSRRQGVRRQASTERNHSRQRDA